jgi:hypothetical protein
MDRRIPIIIASAVLIGSSLAALARAQDAACREAVIRIVAHRHATIALNRQFKRDYAAAAHPASQADINKLNAEVAQMAALEESGKRYLAAMPPRCVDVVLERLRADQAAHPDVSSLK